MLGLLSDAIGAVGGVVEHVSGTLGGLLGSSINFDTASIPDLTGKIILVTGGNVGLGRETCRILALHRPRRIYLCARSAAKAEATIAELKAAQPDAAPVTFLQLDLTDLKSVQACARAFTEKEDRLDVLFCNAGVMALPPGVTKDGYEIQFGTNHLGHALLVKLLLPVLQRTAERPGADVRVISVSSVGHHVAPPEGVQLAALKDEMRHLSTWARYGQSKLANILYARQLTARFPKILSVSVHPGVVDTNLYLTAVGETGLKKLGYWGFKKFLAVSAEEGAKNQLWAAMAPREDLVAGEYYYPVGVMGKGSWQGKDDELGEKLWEWTEKELEGYMI